MILTNCVIRFQAKIIDETVVKMHNFWVELWPQKPPERVSEHLKPQNFLGGHAPRPP